MTIDPKTDPREAALQARELVEYAHMHPGAFDNIERFQVRVALDWLNLLADKAREVC